MNESSQDKTFHTSNTALAAYLITEGFGNPDIEFSNEQAIWVFQKDSTALTDYVRNYHLTKAMTNAAVFFNNYRTLLTRIKEGY